MHISIGHNTNNTYENGEECVQISKRRPGECLCTYAGIGRINTQIENEDRHMSRVMRITRAPCPKYVLNLQVKNKEIKNVVINTKPNTHHAALATQLERQVEKKVCTFDTES